MMKYQGVATIKNVNLRRENEAGSEFSRLGSDLKLQIRAQASILTTLLGDRELAAGLRRTLWTDNGDLRSFQIGSLALQSKFQRHQVQIGEHEFRGVTLDSFTATPEGEETVQLEFRIKMHPDDDDVAKLSHYLVVGTVKIAIAGEQDELALGEPEGAEA